MTSKAECLSLWSSSLRMHFKFCAAVGLNSGKWTRSERSFTNFEVTWIKVVSGIKGAHDRHEKQLEVITWRLSGVVVAIDFWTKIRANNSFEAYASTSQGIQPQMRNSYIRLFLKAGEWPRHNNCHKEKRLITSATISEKSAQSLTPRKN